MHSFEKENITPNGEPSVNLNDVHESLQHAIEVLTSILNDVETGNYTREQAAVDAEDLTMTEGLDFISVLHNYSDGI